MGLRTQFPLLDKGRRCKDANVSPRICVALSSEALGKDEQILLPVDFSRALRQLLILSPGTLKT